MKQLESSADYDCISIIAACAITCICALNMVHSCTSSHVYTLFIPCLTHLATCSHLSLYSTRCIFCAEGVEINLIIAHRSNVDEVQVELGNVCEICLAVLYNVQLCEKRGIRKGESEGEKSSFT